jgi:hypothetical protein
MSKEVTFLRGAKTYTAPQETLKLLLEQERKIEELKIISKGLEKNNLDLSLRIEYLEQVIYEIEDRHSRSMPPIKEASIHDLVNELSKRNEGCVIAIQCQDEKNRYEFYLGEKDLIATGGLLNLLNARMKLIVEETILAEEEEDGDEVGSL